MSKNEKAPHTPIMVEEVLKGFEESHLRVFYEGTVGAGGHAKAILEAHPEIELYIACDKDPNALCIAANALKKWKEKIYFVHGSFSDLDLHLEKQGIEKVNGFFLIWESLRCSLMSKKEDLVLAKRDH